MNLSKDTLQKLAALVAALERDNPKLDLRIRCGVLRLKGGSITIPVRNLSMGELEPWFWSMVKPNPDTHCWEWQGVRDQRGYGKFKTQGQRWLAHRASLFYILGPSPLFGCHKCSNPPCVNPFHLYYGTREDNWRDMKSLGRGPKTVGSENGRARITEDDVAFITSSPLKLKELGKLYEMTPQNIWRIRRRFRSWKHVSRNHPGEKL